MKSHRSAGLTVIGLRRAVICKPLVVLLCVLLLPSIPRVQRFLPGLAPQVDAQIGTCTVTSGNTIIRNYCGADGTLYLNDLKELEADAVKAYLAAHNIPETDAHVVYDYGRADLRSKIRAFISSALLSVIAIDPSKRTPHQQQLYKWIQGWVQLNEINSYKKAIEHFQAWRNDPCHFVLDPVVAKQYGLSYDGAPFCGNSLSSVFAVPAPAPSYFKTYGLRAAYTAPAANEPAYARALADLHIDVAAIAEAAAASSGVVAAALGAGAYASLFAVLQSWIYSVGGSAGILAASETTVLAATLSLDVLRNLSTIGLVAPPVFVLVICIAVGVTASIQVFDNDANLRQLEDLSNTLASVTATPPDLKIFASDTTGLGLFKLQNTILAQTLPDVPSTAPLPAHRDGVDALFFVEAFFQKPFSYRDWDENIWTAQAWGGWIVQTCKDGPTGKCPQADSITADLRYRQPTPIHPGETELQNWTAARFGTTFINSRAERTRYDQRACEADLAKGYSTEQDLSKCSSYVYPSLSYEAGDGSPMMTDLEMYSAVFSRPAYLSFTAGVKSTQTITLASTPYKSNIFIEETNGGTLTSNPDFTIAPPAFPSPDFNTLQITFNGNAAAPSRNYTLNVYGAVFPEVKQTYTISVRNDLKITSPATLTATAGAPVNFLVTATGSPAPALSIDPELMGNGLTFTDNGNGTATIAGVPVLPGDFECSTIDLGTGTSRPCGIQATNAQGTVRQRFSISLASAPVASVAPQGGATFTAGLDNQVLLTSTGATTPVTWDFIPDPTAPWLTLHDNGTGTALLSGTPPLGTVGTFFPTAVPRALGSRGLAPVFPVTVVNRLAFTSPNTATFTAGAPGSFRIASNIGAIDLNEQALPAGLTFVAGNPAEINGTPGAGTGGQYTLTVTDDAGGGETATQFLVLNVNEAPHFSGASRATMFVGMPGSLAVTTTGFPSVSTHVVAADALPPASADTGDGMHFTVTGLPASLTASNLNPQGFATGTLTIQGTPAGADAGLHQVTITARNGVGPGVQRTFTLTIVSITGPAPSSGTTCNGNYTGTFNGSISVAAGQNCAFYFGGVTGNVQVLGGSFAVTGARIAGNVAIQGATAFSIGAGTTITGNLTIANVGSASATNQLCGTTVSGNVNVASNAVPITIGSPSTSCLGNSFGGNVGITSNTAPIQVFDNDVRKNLSCSGNASITGGSNLAGKKTGQCSGF